MEMASNFLQRMWVNPFSLKRLDPLVKRFPFLAIFSGVLIALLGYVVLFGFPVAALLLLKQLPQQFSTITDQSGWVMLAVTLLVIAFCGWMSWYMVQTPFKQPRGLVLEYKMAPELFKLVSALESAFTRSRVHRVVLSDNHDNRLIRTPRYGLPFYTENTLVIGLPLLLSLSPDHFKTLLARRIGQTGGRHNYITGWIAQLWNIWPQYRDNYAGSKTIPGSILHTFFRLYIPVFRYFSYFAARLDELEADRYALEYVGDEVMNEAIAQDYVVRAFLKKNYWPQAKQLLRNKPDAKIFPYRQMSRMVQTQLKMENANRWLAKAVVGGASYSRPQPSLRSRIENIGYQVVSEPVPLSGLAATEYLHSSVLPKVIDKFDQRWQKRQSYKRGRRDKKRASEQQTNAAE